MGLFDLFKNKKPEEDQPLSYYHVDFHSHLIPGVDDGSRSYEESIEIITFFQSLGVRKMITTPHISMDHFPNKHGDLAEKFLQLKEKVSEAGIEIELGLAAEYMIDDGFREIMNKVGLLTFGNNYLLVELSGFAEHPDFSSLIFDLQSSGYNVILAHPERYLYMDSNRETFIKMKEREVLFQVNALSLAGVYSERVMKTAKWLIENNMIDFVGSDVHHASQKGLFRKAIQSKLFAKLNESATVRNSEL